MVRPRPQPSWPQAAATTRSYFFTQAPEARLTIDPIVQLRELKQRLDATLALADASGEVLIAIHIAEALDHIAARIKTIEDCQA